MSQQIPVGALDALRDALLHIEAMSGLAADDPSLIYLKRILGERISELEAMQAAELHHVPG